MTFPVDKRCCRVLSAGNPLKPFQVIIENRQETTMTISRRRMILASAGLALPWTFSFSKNPEGSAGTNAISPAFPAQDQERVRTFVAASHGNIDVVRRMLQETPALAKSTYDWGFGDWESALGAASHVGNRTIAAMLIDHGARPDLFTFAMLGQLHVVKAYVEASPGIQKIRGPHGLTLLHHARQGGTQSEEVVAYLEQVGDANIRPDSLPLDQKEMARFAGSFTSNGGESIRLDFAISRQGLLSVKRQPNGTARNMHFLGDHTFAPIGAEAVRIRFNDALSQCTVVDGPLNMLLSRMP